MQSDTSGICVYCRRVTYNYCDGCENFNICSHCERKTEDGVCIECSNDSDKVEMACWRKVRPDPVWEKVGLGPVESTTMEGPDPGVLFHEFDDLADPIVFRDKDEKNKAALFALEKAIENEASFGLIMALTDLACYDMPDLAKQFRKLKKECLCNDVLDENRRVPFARRIKQLIKDANNTGDMETPFYGDYSRAEQFRRDECVGCWSAGTTMGLSSSPVLFCQPKQIVNVVFKDSWMITKTMFLDDLLVSKIPVEIVD